MTQPIDVIIPTRQPPNALAQLIDQIGRTARHPHNIVYTGDETGSAARNRNLGLERSGADVVVMVDDDIEFWVPEAFGWLRVLAEALARPEVVMVSAQLLKPEGGFAYMTGLDDCGGKPRRDGEWVVPTRTLLTACCGIKPHGLRFDEGYVGSGFEDCDFCHRLAAVKPDGVFLVCHAALAVHRNEAKEQRGRNWRQNEARYKHIWGNR